MNEYYPVYLRLSAKKCVVIGGGKVAERKVKSLLECGAEVWVISPEFTQWLEEAAGRGEVVSVRKNFTVGDLEDAFLVIGATDDNEANDRVAEECSKRNILVNIVDDPDRCNFIVPAVIRQGPLSISISTDGRSPMLARRIREELATTFGDEYREFLELMGIVREHVIKNVSDQEERKGVFERLVYSDIIDLLREGQHEKVKERIDHVLGSGWTKS